MACEACGRSAPTKDVVFHQHIGLVILRLESEAGGNLCKSCIHQAFIQTTAICLFFGWWGVISFFMNIFCIGHNVIEWAFCLSMPSQHGAGNQSPATQQVEVNIESEQLISPYAREIQTRLRRGDTVAITSHAIAQETGAPQKEVIQFIRKHYARLK